MNSATTSSSALMRYRTIDLVTIATLGVAFGVVFWGWGKLYEPISGLAVFSFPPSSALLSGPWLIAGVVGGLVVRKPGAALSTELIAASVSALVPGGTQWGSSVVVSGILQGLGAELVLALFLYRRFGVLIAAIGGMLSGIFEALYEWGAYYSDWDFGYRLVHLSFLGLSGLVVAGVGGFYLVQALARAGVLDSFESGREHVAEV